MPVDCIRYSDAFKQKVISEIESGKFPSRNAAKRFYGIKGGATIRGWLKQYGKLHLTGRIIRVESGEERDQVKELKEQIRTLKDALATSACRESIAVSHFELTCEKFNVKDPEELKKNFAAKLSPSQSDEKTKTKVKTAEKS